MLSRHLTTICLSQISKYYVMRDLKGAESCNVVATKVLNKAKCINNFCKKCRAKCHLKQLSIFNWHSIRELLKIP